MRPLIGALALIAAWFASSPSLAASVVARIDLSEQRMDVYVNGFPRYRWAVSTARQGYHTPVGTFHPQRLEEMWHSRKYDMSPMPHSIFFLGGYAIHGTDVVRLLGKPASHGCVRLDPSNAAKLYALVTQNGVENTKIVVTR